MDRPEREREALSTEGKTHPRKHAPCLRCDARGRNRACALLLCEHCCAVVELDDRPIRCGVPEHDAYKVHEDCRGPEALIKTLKEIRVATKRAI
jgi:hypothetical protein